MSLGRWLDFSQPGGLWTAEQFDRLGIQYSLKRHFPDRSIEEEKEIWQRAAQLGYVNKSSSLDQTDANGTVCILTTGLGRVPQQYRLLAKHTQSFIDVATQIARLPDGFVGAARLLIDLPTSILFADGSCFVHMLNSQRCHIFWLLDDALLRLCMDEWEKPPSPAEASEPSWDVFIAPLRDQIAEKSAVVPSWVNNDSAPEQVKAAGWAWRKRPLLEFTSLMEAHYFVRTRNFLDESLGVFRVRKIVNACSGGRFPKEVADEIIDHVLIHEGLSPGWLRSKYFPKGKGKLQ